MFSSVIDGIIRNKAIKSHVDITQTSIFNSGVSVLLHRRIVDEQQIIIGKVRGCEGGDIAIAQVAYDSQLHV